MPGWNTVCAVPASRATPVTSSESALPFGPTRSDSVPAEVCTKVPLIVWVVPLPAALMPSQPRSRTAHRPGRHCDLSIDDTPLTTTLPDAVGPVAIV